MECFNYSHWDEELHVAAALWVKRIVCAQRLGCRQWLCGHRLAAWGWLHSVIKLIHCFIDIHHQRVKLRCETLKPPTRSVIVDAGLRRCVWSSDNQGSQKLRWRTWARKWERGRLSTVRESVGWAEGGIKAGSQTGSNKKRRKKKKI